MKNSLPIGLLLGVIFPFIAYILTKHTNLQTSFFLEKPIALYVIAAFINLIIFRFAYRAGKNAFAKGVLMMTFVAMILLIFGTGLKI